MPSFDNKSELSQLQIKYTDLKLNTVWEISPYFRGGGLDWLMIMQLCLQQTPENTWEMRDSLKKGKISPTHRLGHSRSPRINYWANAEGEQMSHDQLTKNQYGREHAQKPEESSVAEFHTCSAEPSQWIPIYSWQIIAELPNCIQLKMMNDNS